MYNYKVKGIWNPVRLVVGETLNCKSEVKNPQDLYVVSLRKYDTTFGHVLRLISCICTLFFNEAWRCHPAHFNWPTTVLIPKTCHREV